MASLDNFTNSINQMREWLNAFDESTIPQNEFQKFARSKKILEYIEGYTKNLDQDLLPNEFYKEIDYIISHRLNSYTDFNIKCNMCLKALAQYSNVYIPKNQASKTISEMVSSYDNTIRNALNNVDLDKVQADTNQIEKNNQEIEELKTKILESKEKLDQYYKDIESYQIALFEKQENSELSIKQEIEDYKNTLLNDVKNAKELIAENSNKIDEIDKFYVKIFGDKGDDDKRSGGLKQHLDTMLAELKEYDDKMKAKHDEYDKMIKGLHERATNASLSASYQKEKNDIGIIIILCNSGFIACVITLILLSIWTLEDIKVLLANMVDTNAFNVALFSFIGKFVISLPVIWFAVFCSNRRKEAARLYQEYAHKVAVTSSYASYKDQIQNLNEENQELLIKLMSSAIDIISKNPSDFMDKTQNNKTIGIDSLIKNFKELPQELKDFIIDKFRSSAK
ncbi:hypothetical protein [Campylobacter sp.]|uniref:hypothetical protein n=1 Tax=Campylobacter sp. TaxID=205 RepID=UPI00259C73C6|nr:hypothetical protein [Campylobacter sp.]MBQ8819684.1 hypothetical protein [Campylobacter sp.]